MSIAKEFNDLAVSLGGTADKSGTIAGAIDAVNDALAGSDQPAAQSIGAAIKLLGTQIEESSEGGEDEFAVIKLFPEQSPEGQFYTEPQGTFLLLSDFINEDAAFFEPDPELTTEEEVDGTTYTVYGYSVPAGEPIVYINDDYNVGYSTIEWLFEEFAIGFDPSDAQGHALYIPPFSSAGEYQLEIALADPENDNVV